MLPSSPRSTPSRTWSSPPPLLSPTRRSSVKHPVRRPSPFTTTLTSHLPYLLSLLLVLCNLVAATDVPLATHFRAFGPLPYTSSQRGLNPLLSLRPPHDHLLPTLASLSTFPSESAVGGHATWRDCVYNASEQGRIVAPFPDADPSLPYNAYALANFSVRHDAQRPFLLQCSDPATITTVSLRPDFQHLVNQSSVSLPTHCSPDLYEDGRGLCVARLYPGTYRVLIHLSSSRNSTAFYCNHVFYPDDPPPNLLHPIPDFVTPNVIVSAHPHASRASLAGAHCSVTLMNAHHKLWATAGSAHLRHAPDGLRLAPQSESDKHFPLPRIAPGQTRQLRVDLLADSSLLRDELTHGSTPKALNVSIAVSYEIGQGAVFESVFNLTFDVSVWGEDRSYHFTYLDVDGSVQAAAVLPPKKSCMGAPAGQDACPVLLSTHGAGVDAIGNAWTEAYHRQEQAWVLLPTGRRKYGLNWEGPQMNSAITALHALCDALPGVPEEEREMFKARKDHWLQAGHSMGGHGALLLSTHFPDMLVASLPAMGWLRLSSYGAGRKEEDLPYSDAGARALLEVASEEFSADLYSENLLGIPFLARVGSDDNNAIQMLTVGLAGGSRSITLVFTCRASAASNLRKFTRLLKENEFFTGANRSVATLDEVPGEGHWFDGVVDDDKLQYFIAKHLNASRKPELPEQFSLVTMNPASSGSRGGLSILSLEVPFQLARLRVSRGGPQMNSWKIETENVRRIRYQPVAGIIERPESMLIDDSTQPISVPTEILDKRNQQLDICAGSLSPYYPESTKEGRHVVWAKCRDANSWGHVENMERGADSTGPSSQVLSRRRLVVVFPEGDVELQAVAVAYANALYVRGISVQVTPDSNVSVGQLTSSGETNMVLLGGPNMNRMALKHFQGGFSADVSFTGSRFCVASRKCFEEPGVGVAFLSGGPKRTLLFYAAGTDRDGVMAALAFLPYSPSSNVPEWIIVSKKRGWGYKGLGGILALGYWDYLWRLDIRKSYPAEFAFDLKRSGSSCAVGQDSASDFSWRLFAGIIVVAGLGCAVMRWRKRMPFLKPRYEALRTAEEGAVKSRQGSGLREQEELLTSGDPS